MRVLTRFLRALPLLVLSPILVLVPFAALAVSDLVFLLLRSLRLRRASLSPENTRPSTKSASVVIPNWNGRDLLERYLPSVVAALEGHPDNEVIVVDNGSTDGSAEYVRRAFPQVRLLALPRNLGFGGGSNAGFRAARNDIVVLLNSDMRVEPDFLAPLLEGFSGGDVFAVSCQIFFNDPRKIREETGLTQGWWENGGLRVRHRIDDQVNRLFPCFYGGGGSCAFDRRKFLELGAFDPLLAPFYLEDTDLGYMAWKRGWKVLYQPQSVVCHEHRGTIGKRFSDAEIQRVLQKNFILFCWKNVHEWPRLVSHFFFTCTGALLSLILGDSRERANLSGMWIAFRQLPGAIGSRWRARKLAAIGDTEAFLRPLGGYFRDRFQVLPARPNPLRVLFVSPYPIFPPVHGGAVFMSQTCLELVRLCELHIVVLIDYANERRGHEELARQCASAEFLVRLEGDPKTFGSISPHAIHEFASKDLHWLIHRQIYLHDIDVLQLEYLPMGQYAGEFRQIASILFEHDIYFQSIGRGLPQAGSLLQKGRSAYEYLRALRYELRLLPRMDRVQVCSAENARYLESFLPRLGDRIDAVLRAGIDPSRYAFQPHGREPFTMLFLGSFRHQPNVEALDWFVRRVLPGVCRNQPQARLIVIGSDPPPRHFLPEAGAAIELRGFVEDVKEPLARYAVFVCPILSGSGVRVKVLEAFAAGMPVVSTRLGAEGLAAHDGRFCALADDPAEFAAKILHLFKHPEEAAAMAGRARAEVEANRDMGVLARRLVASYQDTLATKRGGSGFKEAVC